MPGFRSFFKAFLHVFVLAKLATSSIRVKMVGLSVENIYLLSLFFLEVGIPSRLLLQVELHVLHLGCHALTLSTQVGHLPALLLTIF